MLGLHRCSACGALRRCISVMSFSTHRIGGKKLAWVCKNRRACLRRQEKSKRGRG